MSLVRFPVAPQKTSVEAILLRFFRFCSERITCDLGVARAACFEQLAGVFASCGALHYAKILASLKIKNGISLTPLNCALNAFTFALNDSADALVERLSK